jgi:hypothetical protein
MLKYVSAPRRPVLDTGLGFFQLRCNEVAQSLRALLIFALFA